MSEQKPEGATVGCSALLGRLRAGTPRTNPVAGMWLAETGEADALMRQAADELDRLTLALDQLEMHALRDVAPGWVSVPASEWDAVVTPNALAHPRICRSEAKANASGAAPCWAMTIM